MENFTCCRCGVNQPESERSAAGCCVTCYEEQIEKEASCDSIQDRLNRGETVII